MSNNNQQPPYPTFEQTQNPHNGGGYNQQPPPYGFQPSAMPQAQAAFARSQFPTYTNSDPYNGEDAGFTGPNLTFSDVKIRHAFIRKVYLILTVQLTITIGFMSLFIFFEPVKGWFRANYWVHWVIIAATFVILIVLACCDGVTRKYPLNMILLMAFTILESLLLGSISASYKTDAVFIAVGITAIVVVGITIFSFQTKIDFTGMGMYLFVAVLVLFGFGLLAAIIRSNILRIVYAALGAGIFSMYLVFDTQLMLGGKHKFSISPEEYIVAALNLYLDIINLFLMILQLVGGSRD